MSSQDEVYLYLPNYIYGLNGVTLIFTFWVQNDGFGVLAFGDN
jgi:hypothetical protein